VIAREPELWDVLARWRAQGRCFVLATVTGTRGFTPRKGGARMLIAENGETAGTIGGGAIEQAVLEEARGLFARGGSSTLRHHLTQELGMCCGGEMTVFLEAIVPMPRLVVFGAGYIARPLASLASGCGYEVTVIDERPEWANEERFPTARLERRPAAEAARDHDWRPGDSVVIATHDHALDQQLVQEVLRRDIAFVGMIGSVPKQRKFALRLRARGFSDAEIARLRTPLGLPIGAETPEEIAVSVMAELVAARRGLAPAAGWVPPAGHDTETDVNGPVHDEAHARERAQESRR
jgi:xanthine dehydrogenase accessory factor